MDHVFHVDMQVLEGARYEDTYGKYLDLFRQIAEIPAKDAVLITGAPYSWVPLLRYLRCTTLNSIEYFAHCRHLSVLCDNITIISNFSQDRTMVEVLCGFRPETVDALWKVDMQWKTDRPHYTAQREFIVTNNGSFHRKEVLQFRRRLEAYTPPARNVVLVPCAADKPYPAPMHAQVLSMLPDGWYMMNATGVLGLVPTDLWPYMPYYDSGIPNEWRLMTTVIEYFSKHKHDRVVVYCDFYNLAIKHGFSLMTEQQDVTFVNPVVFYYDYIDLLDPMRLEALRAALV